MCRSLVSSADFSDDGSSPQHSFQVLTSERSVRQLRKMPARRSLDWGERGRCRVFHRIADLLHVPAAIRVISANRYGLGWARIDLRGIHWVDCRGYSGRVRGTMESGVREIFRACR